MIAVIRLMNTSFTAHNLHFVAVVIMRAFEIFSQQFSSVNTVLLTVDVIMYITDIFSP